MAEKLESAPGLTSAVNEAVAKAPSKRPTAIAGKSMKPRPSLRGARHEAPPVDAVLRHISELRESGEYKLDDLVLIDLDEPLTDASRHKLELLVNAIGWDSQVYINANPDVTTVDEEGGDARLLAHFVRNGIKERRRFSEEVIIPKGYVFDNAIRADDFILVIGWSEYPLSQPSVLLELDAATVALAPAAHLNLWRDDVAKHLGVPVRREAHGFIVGVKIPEGNARSDVQIIIADGTQLLVGPISPKPVELNDYVKTALSILQERLTYEEMVQTFDEHYPFVEFLRDPMAAVRAEEPVRLEYRAGDQTAPVDMSVCAVLLGKALMLKPFFASLMPHRPQGARWEILLHANNQIELENIRSAAEWCSEAYGVDVKLSATRGNLGFGGGHNLLVSQAQGQVTMMTNIDLRFAALDANSVAKEVLGSKSIVAAYQFNPNGSLQHEGLVHDRRSAVVNSRLVNLLDTRLVGRNTFNARVVRKEVEYFGAACVVADTRTLQALGPFSDDYLYAYHEDCDLARRVRADGGACLLSPALQIVHYESSGAANIAMPLRAINAANLVSFMRADQS